MKAYTCLVALVLLAVAVQVHCQFGCAVTVQFDNKAGELNKQNKEITQEVRKEVCKGGGTPRGPSGQIVDKSNAFDSQSTATYVCSARSQSEAQRYCNNCVAAQKKPSNFKDELEDSTDFPEIEVEKITRCQVVSTTGRRFFF